VILLTPLLRLADNLDRSHEGRIEDLECSLQDGQVLLKLSSKEEIDLEQWAAERSATAFREIYGREIVLSKSKP